MRYVFHDRTDAGKQLAHLLTKQYGNSSCVVYALPRGGVVTAVEVANMLKAPLDLLIVRKIGHPGNPEYAIGAISEHSHIAKGSDFNDMDESSVRKIIQAEKEEILRRKKLYLKDRKEKDVKGKIALIVDDGIATGLTMKSAIMEIKEKKPEKIVVVAAVMPKEVETELKTLADGVVSLSAPTDYLGAVGNYYESFPQVTDEEVVEMLQKAQDPIVFGFPSQKSFAELFINISENFHAGKFYVNSFPNKEMYITLQTNVRNKDCIVVALPLSETDLMELLLLCDTLKKEEAKTIVCVLPYLPYGRQDANEKEKSQGYIWFGDMLRSCGVNQILTVDVHNPSLIEYYPIALSSLSPAGVFAEKIQQLDLVDATFIAPDEGAKDRCQQVATALGKREDVAYCIKKREGLQVTSSLIGSISKNAVVIDDMLDTGKTLVACCKHLAEKNVSDITIFVTHGFFTGTEWKQLWSFPVRHIYCTDTIPLSTKDKRISVLSIKKSLAEEMKKLYV